MSGTRGSLMRSMLKQQTGSWVSKEVSTQRHPRLQSVMSIDIDELTFPHLFLWAQSCNHTMLTRSVLSGFLVLGHHHQVSYFSFDFYWSSPSLSHLSADSTPLPALSDGLRRVCPIFPDFCLFSSLADDDEMMMSLVFGWFSSHWFRLEIFSGYICCWKPGVCGFGSVGHSPCLRSIQVDCFYIGVEYSCLFFGSGDELGFKMGRSVLKAYLALYIFS